MSNALKYYQENINLSLANRIEELEMLSNIGKSAQLWLNENNYFNAGYVYWQGTDIAWGIDNKRLFDFYNNSINCLSISLRQLNCSSEIVILSLRLLRDIYSDILSLGIEQVELQKEVSKEFKNVTLILASKLLEKYSVSKCSDFLLKTISIEGKLTGDWSIKLPNEESRIWKEKCSSHKIPSAFDLYLSIGDYSNAYELIKLEPAKFETNELKGWKNAVIGFVFPEKRIDCFNKVVLEFEKNSKEGWFVSTDVWIKYFKARVFLENGFENPPAIKKSIVSALNILKGSDKSFINYQVLRYKYVVEALYGLIELQEPDFIMNAEKEYLKVMNSHVTLNEDFQILAFFKEAVGLVANAQNNYSEAFFKFGSVIEILDRLILLPVKSGKKLLGHIGENLKVIVGGGTNWIHRTLENIKPETKLQKVLLRLFQKLPSDVNVIVHGTLENGRDIFHLERETSILKSYQVKLGNIRLADWRNEIKPQMEEMLEVSPPESLNKYSFSKRIGVLVFTGHIRPNAEAAVNGWKNTKLTENKEYELMNIDDIKNFIVDNNLVAEFQRTLIEEQIKITN